MAVAIILFVVVLVLALRATKVIGADERAVVYRLGRVLPGTRGPGLVIVAPIIDRLVRVPANEQKAPLKDVAVVTSDNAAIHVDATIEFRIADAARALTEVADYRDALAQSAATALRAASGEMTLNEILAERATLSRRVHSQLVMNARGWGLEIGDVVLDNIDAPDEVVHRLQAQALAEGQRRERILEHESGE